MRSSSRWSVIMTPSSGTVCLFRREGEKNKLGTSWAGARRRVYITTTTCRHRLCCAHLSRKVKARTDAHKDTHTQSRHAQRNKPRLSPLFRSDPQQQKAEDSGPGAEAVIPPSPSTGGELLPPPPPSPRSRPLSFLSGRPSALSRLGDCAAAAAGFFPNCAGYSLLWIELRREAMRRCSACARAAAGVPCFLDSVSLCTSN